MLEFSIKMIACITMGFAMGLFGNRNTSNEETLELIKKIYPGAHFILPICVIGVIIITALHYSSWSTFIQNALFIFFCFIAGVIISDVITDYNAYMKKIQVRTTMGSMTYLGNAFKFLIYVTIYPIKSISKKK